MWQFYKILQEFTIYKSVTFGRCVGSAIDRRFGNKFRRTFSDDRSGVNVRLAIKFIKLNFF